MHQIRLAGPWESLNPSTGSWTRLKLPIAAATSEIHVVRRKFHRPGGLTTASVVKLLITATADISAVQINGTEVESCHAEGSATVFVVTDLLDEFNELQLNISAALGPQSELLTVCLGICDGPEPETSTD